MNEVEPITHLLSLGVIMLVSGFFALKSFGIDCAKQMHEEIDDDCDPEPGEVDTTYYPDDEEEDNVIFRH